MILFDKIKKKKDQKDLSFSNQERSQKERKNGKNIGISRNYMNF
jgi:hypothetical protein